MSPRPERRITEPRAVRLGGSARVESSLGEEVAVASKLLPMLRTDVAGRVVEWNEQLAELTGISSRDMLGEPLISRVLPDGQSRVQRMLSRALQGHVEKSVHAPLRCRVGDLVLSLGASCHYNVAGDVVGVLAVAQLISSDQSGSDLASPEPVPAGGTAQVILECAGVAMVSCCPPHRRGASSLCQRAHLRRQQRGQGERRLGSHVGSGARRACHDALDAV